MKTLISLPLLVLLAACSSSKGGPAPVISQFELTSPVATTASSITGSVDVADTAGLTDLTADLVVTGPVSTTLSISVQGGSTSETEAMVPLELILGSTIPAGTYQVTITLSENGETSNTLDASLVVQ